MRSAQKTRSVRTGDLRQHGVSVQDWPGIPMADACCASLLGEPITADQAADLARMLKALADPPGCVRFPWSPPAKTARLASATSLPVCSADEPHPESRVHAGLASGGSGHLLTLCQQQCEHMGTTVVTDWTNDA
jgi:hypothetical protein